jgi:hypothetical protein
MWQEALILTGISAASPCTITTTGDAIPVEEIKESGDSRG